jgi:hypothetical protein
MSIDSAKTYQVRAQECLAIAAAAVDAIERVEFMQIAQAYRRLAEHALVLATIPTTQQSPDKPRPTLFKFGER